MWGVFENHEILDKWIWKDEKKCSVRHLIVMGELGVPSRVWLPIRLWGNHMWYRYWIKYILVLSTIYIMMIGSIRTQFQKSLFICVNSVAYNSWVQLWVTIGILWYAFGRTSLCG